MIAMIDLAKAAALDADDALAGFCTRFVVTDDALRYLDGNSLGRLSTVARDAVLRTLDQEWGEGLVRSWHEWIDLSTSIGDELAPLLGASDGEVLVCDQTSVNLYKLAWAGLARSGRSVIVGDDSNFPSDRYVLAEVAQAQGGVYREMQVDPIEGPRIADVECALADGDVGVLSMSMVAFKSGAIVDVPAITELAHAHGALVLWDLSHAAGAIPARLNETGADMAVGCTYKHLNGGPGAPAFLYVRSDLQAQLDTPIPGWFGHAAMFAFEGEYRPAEGIRRFAIGTPPILSLRAAQAGIAVSAEAGIEAIRAKSTSLTEMMIARADERLAPLGFELASPRESARRGAHISLSHEHGYQITQAVIERGVVPDFRAPSLIRLGVAPLYNSHCEAWQALEALAEVVETRDFERFPAQASGVT